MKFNRLLSNKPGQSGRTCMCVCMQDKCFIKDLNNDYLCAYTCSCTLSPHGPTIHQNAISLPLVSDFCPSCRHSDCLYHGPCPGECLSEANWIFLHISINNYYAYNTRFSLPAHTNTVQFHYMCFFCGKMNSYSNNPWITLLSNNM